MKSDKTYIVRRLREKLGSLNFDQILEQLEEGQPICYFQVYLESQNSWIPLHEAPEWHQALAIQLSSIKTNSSKRLSSFCHWTLADSGQGPFTFIQTVQLLQQNKIVSSQRVVHPRLKTLKRIADITQFSSENIEALHSFPLLKPIFQQRKNLRVQYENRALLKTSQSILTGHTWSLSHHGVGLELDTNQWFNVGEIFQIGLFEHSDHPRVETEAQVVSCTRGQLGTRVSLKFPITVPAIANFMGEIVP